MSEQIHDWWSNLTPFERAYVRHHEKERDKKLKLISFLRKSGRALKLIEKLKFEAAGHKAMRQEYQNRGTQRARLGCKPKIDKRIRRRSYQTMQATG